LFEPKNILVPTDFSNYSQHALRQAVDIARHYQSKISLLHVVDEAVQQCMVDYCLPEAVMRQLDAQSMKASADKLQDEISKLGDTAFGIEIIPVVKRGVPYDEIVKEQEMRHIDLIVMTSHGKTGILKTMLGGVVERVLREAKCPMLLLRM
jgi:nucleotide-binding universal stress UspA family protein